MVAPLSAEEACDRLDVSRETRQRLEIYVALLKRWQRSINLVSTATLDDVWRRHILDSGQVFRHLSRPHDLIMDIGSGAGLPGLVLLGYRPVLVKAVFSINISPQIHAYSNVQLHHLFMCLGP